MENKLIACADMDNLLKYDIRCNFSYQTYV